MLYDLRRSDVRVRWLVTLLLVTLGASYAFGAWMVGLYAGFGTRKVAETYGPAGESMMAMQMPPDTTVVVEHAIAPAEMGEEHHHVDRGLLVQDTHVHMPMYAVIAACLSVIALGLTLSRWACLALIGLLFAARELHLSSADSKRLHDAVGWEPPDGVLTFYVGKQQNQVTGALLFMRVDCQHGPLELAIGFEPRGTIRGVEVTKATVEMKPWVMEALRAGLTDGYRGLTPEQVPAAAAKVKSRIGAMPGYMAELSGKR